MGLQTRIVCFAEEFQSGFQGQSGLRLRGQLRKTEGILLHPKRYQQCLLSCKNLRPRLAHFLRRCG
jgi:hypothetical protein